jgi:hypothetical protein
MPISRTDSLPAHQNGAEESEAITHSLQDGLATAMEFPRKVIEAQLDTSAEILTFISKRMRAQANFVVGVGHSHDATEAAEIQRLFWEKVTEDYSQELNHLAQIIQKNLSNARKTMSSSANGSGNMGRAM